MKLNFQFAHHSHTESETIKVATQSDVLKEFDKFDWLDEAKKASEIQKCAPTFTVIFQDQIEFMWVSCFLEDAQLRLISECNFPGEVSSLFGLVKKQGVINLHSHSFTLNQTREAVGKFLTKDHSALQAMYA